MIYSHGNFGFAEAHYTLCEHFASHGWTVIAPDHTGNTWNSFSERDTDTYLNRPQDLSASLNAVAPDAEQVAVVGHSYGGYTSFSIAGATPDLDDCDDPNNDSDFCSLMDESRRATFAKVVDARVGVIIPMAAGNSKQISGDGSGVAAIDVPVFLLTGSLDNSNSNESDGDPYWNGLNGPTDRRLNITNGGHQSFASTCLHYEVGLVVDGALETNTSRRKKRSRLSTKCYLRYHLTADTAQADRLNGRYNNKHRTVS